MGRETMRAVTRASEPRALFLALGPAIIMIGG